MLSEISQTEKRQTLYVLIYMWNLKNIQLKGREENDGCQKTRGKKNRETVQRKQTFIYEINTFWRFKVQHGYYSS